MKILASLFALELSLTQLTWSAPANAQLPTEELKALDVQEARQHFNQGVKLYNEGDFGPALAQFQRAYELKPHFRVLYNIAQCQFELRDYVEAHTALARYLTDAGSAIEPERRAKVESDLADLGRRIARLEIRSNVRGAVVYVDGRRLGTTPLPDAVEVNEGQRLISLESAARGTKQRSLLLVGAERQTITVDFEDSATASSTADARSRPSGSPPPPAPSGLGAGFVLATTGTVVFGIGAGVTGYLALTAQKERRDDLDRLGVSASELATDQRRIQTFALTSDILLGSAIVCAGVATTLFIVQRSDRRTSVAVGPGNVALAGSF